jgi:hypothetical protein
MILSPCLTTSVIGHPGQPQIVPTRVTARPDEQLALNMRILRVLELYTELRPANNRGGACRPNRFHARADGYPLARLPRLWRLLPVEP